MKHPQKQHQQSLFVVEVALYVPLNSTQKIYKDEICEFGDFTKLRMVVSVQPIGPETPKTNYCLLYRARSTITKLLIPTHAHFHWLKFIKNV